jgi:hypothetical protein
VKKIDVFKALVARNKELEKEMSEKYKLWKEHRVKENSDEVRAHKAQYEFRKKILKEKLDRVRKMLYQENYTDGEIYTIIKNA